VDISTELESGLPVVNLVSNALDAMAETTDRERVLRLMTRSNGQDTVSVTVQDSGPGIDPSKIDGAFNAFVTTKTQGTGLGLAICRMIIEHHGGVLSASSDGKSGASFQFTLPIERSKSK
jgi:signal transduction histidine kinase